MMVNLGGGHYLADKEIIVIFKKGMLPAKQIFKTFGDTRETVSLVGIQKARSFVITQQHIYLSNVAPETLVKRMQTPCSDTEESDT